MTAHPIRLRRIALALALLAIAAASYYLARPAEAQSAVTVQCLGVPVQVDTDSSAQIGLVNLGDSSLQVRFSILDGNDLSTLSSSPVTTVPAGTGSYFLDEFASFRVVAPAMTIRRPVGADLDFRASTQFFSPNNTELIVKFIFADGFESGDCTTL